MSRSALHRQLMSAVARGEAPTQDPLEYVNRYLPSDRATLRRALPIHGDARTMNLEGVLATNIVADYGFRDNLLPLTSVDEWMEYAADVVDHVEPWEPGTARTPSTAFCCLFRLGLFRPSRSQVHAVLNCPRSPYVRAIGLLWLRFVSAPADLWYWAEPHIDDPTPFSPMARRDGAGGGDGTSQGDDGGTSFGAWLQDVLCNRQYGNTQFPRIPLRIEAEIVAQVELVRMDLERCEWNQAALDSGDVDADTVLASGATVRSRWSEDGRWYKAVIEGPATRKDGINYRGKWLVTYGEIGQTEVRGLGQLKLPGVRYRAHRPPTTHAGTGRVEEHVGGGGVTRRHRSQSPPPPRLSSPSRSASPSRADRWRGLHDAGGGWASERWREGSEPRGGGGGMAWVEWDESDGEGETELEAARKRIQERERGRAVASGKDYAARVLGYKESMAVRMKDYNVRPLTIEPDRPADRGGRDGVGSKPSIGAEAGGRAGDAGATAPATSTAPAPAPPPLPPSAEALARREALLRAYGSTDGGHGGGGDAHDAGEDDVITLHKWA